MLKKIVLVSTILFLASIIILEFLSRRLCANFRSTPSPCSDLVEKYILDDTANNSYILTDEKEVTLSQIKDPEIERQIFDRTIFVPVSEVKANGRVCMNRAFVANELPKRAKRYVVYHENIHLAGVFNETRANYLAARKEPIGFIQTIVYSVKMSLKPNAKYNFTCKLGRLWNIFKIYFLDF